MGRALRFDIRRAGRYLLAAYAVLAVANLVFFLLLTRPQNAKLQALTTHAGPKLQELKQRKAVVEDLEAYVAALDQAELDLDYLRDEVLSTKKHRLIKVQLALQKIAAKFNIALAQVNYSNELLESEGLERLAMVVPLEGGYQGVRGFVQEVESSEEFLVVESVSLAQGKDGGVLVALNITLATYFNAPESATDGRGRPPGRA